MHIPFLLNKRSGSGNALGRTTSGCVAHNHDGERGALVIAFALALPVILGGLALAVDMGHSYSVKTELQAAADAAALAAAQELKLDDNGDVTAAAEAGAAGNGVDLGAATLTVNHPPTAGSRAGNNDYIEVVITEPAPSYFSAALGVGEKDIASRAVAGLHASGAACVVLLNNGDEKALHASGKAEAHLTNCSVYVNSDDDKAAIAEGDSEFVATDILVAGDHYGGGFTPEPTTDVDQVSDPMDYLTKPSYSGCNHTDYYVENTTTIYPGVYCNGILIKGNANITMAPGEYIIKGGGFRVTDDSQVQGDGVMIFNTGSGSYDWKPLEIATTKTVDLSAPDSGAYQGVLIYEDADRAEQGEINIIKGNGFMGSLSGIVYLPKTKLLVHNNTQLVNQNLMIVADMLEINDDAILSIAVDDTTDLFPIGLQHARLVE